MFLLNNNEIQICTVIFACNRSFYIKIKMIIKMFYFTVLRLKKVFFAVIAICVLRPQSGALTLKRSLKTLHTYINI